MKHLMVCVMVLIVLSFSAAQAMDWEQYAVSHDPRDSIFHLNNGDEVIYCSQDSSLSWSRHNKDQLFLTAEECPHLNRLTRIILRQDGSLGILLKSAEDIIKDIYYIGYGVWSSRGFSLIREWESFDGYAIMGDYGILVGSSSGHATLFDLDCQELWQGDLGIGTLSRPYRLFMLSANDWAVGVLNWEQADSFACGRYVSGEMAWMKETIGYPTFLPLTSGSTLIADCRIDGKNGPAYLSLIDLQGHAISSHQVTGNRLSVECHSLHLDSDGHFVIYGSAIGNRRHVYLVWRLILDQRLNFLAMDVRDCNYHDCYAPEFQFGKDGMALVYLIDCDLDKNKAPDILVPFDALPTATNHSLQYE